MEGGVDWILKVENLQEDFIAIQQRLNCFVELPFINTSEHNDYRSYFTTAQQIKIGKVFEQDIDTFKYTF
jgi:hypothetical protein